MLNHSHLSMINQSIDANLPQELAKNSTNQSVDSSLHKHLNTTPILSLIISIASSKIDRGGVKIKLYLMVPCPSLPPKKSAQL